jgi:hypothetical protein
MLRLRNLDMGRATRGLASSVVVIVGAVIVAGCWDAYGELYLPLTDPKLATGGTGSGTSTASSSSSSGTGGTPINCIPADSQDPVADSCGVFVSNATGDDVNGKGTKASPYKKLSTALGKGESIYACADAMPYSEALVLDKAAVIFGGLDCVNWAYDAKKKTQLTANADSIPLTLASSATGAEVHDFAITAIDAKTMGASSIALLDEQAALVLENVDVAAGAGAPGMAGAAQTKVMTPASAKGKDGTDDPTCMTMGVIGGGIGGKNTCDGADTDGGLGGNGVAANNGGLGGEGLPMMIPSNAGKGQTKVASCDAGAKGSDGGPGSPGSGARGIGDISMSGYQGMLGTMGMPGKPGQGGGGGGGARQCDIPGLFAGPSGGGGGAGGCAGLAGALGQPGGSSIGIVVLKAKLTLKTTTIIVKNGGAGGLGGDGQSGADGGQQGNAVGGAACSGGKGGQGGAGGPGGGGAGGHSVGLAIKGGLLPDLTTTTIMAGSGASGGAGGDMDMTAQTKGDDGWACKTLDFGNAMSPGACVK